MSVQGQRHQHPPRVAFQGELGAYSHEALLRYFGAEAEPVPCSDFAEVGRAVTSGSADGGLLPVENSLAGSVVGSYDVLARGELAVVGEIVSPIRHCLLASAGATMEGMTRVLSHPVALAQCRDFFAARPGLHAEAFYDTAGAAREVAARRDPGVGAIASRLAARRYGLVVLAQGIEDRPDNQTRFFAVAPGGVASGTAVPAGRTKTAIMAETRNEPGSLVRLLEPFAAHGVNLCKLESRPAGVPWTYRFFIELEDEGDRERSRDALRAAASASTRLTVLGTFAAG